MENNLYYGQFQIDKYLNDSFIKNRLGGFFVECGAGDGIIESTCLFFEKTLSWKGWNIEPVPWFFTDLIRNRPNCMNTSVALSDTNSTKIFAQPIHPVHQKIYGNGSLKHTKEHKEFLIKENCTFEMFNVVCWKFADLHRRFIPNQKIDLFVLDVEGHEIEALNGILPLEKKYLPEILCVEFPYIGLEKITKVLKNDYLQAGIYENNAIFTKL